MSNNVKIMILNLICVDINCQKLKRKETKNLDDNDKRHFAF